MNGVALTSTHNFCFKAKKKKKKEYPKQPQFHYVKVGCKGVKITRTCEHDDCQKLQLILHWYFYQAQLKVFGMKPK